MEENEISKNRENPLFGRKVYFINPALIVENIVIEDLRSEEYEVYVIDDYHCAKAVLENNKDALVFIYIDDDMDYDQWFNYIKSFSVNEKLKSIFIGVLSYKANYNIRERYLMDLQFLGIKKEKPVITLVIGYPAVKYKRTAHRNNAAVKHL